MAKIEKRTEQIGALNGVAPVQMFQKHIVSICGALERDYSLFYQAH